MRKLASIQIVKDVSPIENADRIEKLTVLGWNLVAKKGELAKHDKCIYFECDSILPDVEAFSFLKTKDDKPIRLRTKKMRGVISQGLALPLSILNDFTDSKTISRLKVGDDVSDIIGVTKYEPPASLRGAGKGYWPSYLHKTDEPRIQSNPEAFEELQGRECYVTVKLDGTSATFSNKDGEFEVCSRNWALKEEQDSVYWRMAKKYSIREKLSSAGNYAIQGEIVGPGIQGNKLQLSDNELYIFNVYNIDASKYLDFKEMAEFCTRLELLMVPVEHELIRFSFTQEDILSMAEGKYEGTNNEREGLVIRPVIESYSEALCDRLSVKAISNRFLLKGGE